MREIEFRGKLDGADKWVYGYYYGGYNWADFIISNEGFEHRQRVMHETIGQYTGLKDKYGTKIFEGDILEWVSCNPFSKGEIRKGQVYYIEAHFWCKGTIGVYLGELLVHEKCEVIGNIHDNPELLK